MGTHIKNNKLLELLSSKHYTWLNMVKSFGANIDDSNDIVQDMYVRLHKYIKDPDDIMYGNEINTLYVYRTLQNLYANLVKENSKTDKHDTTYIFNKFDDGEEMDVYNELERIKLEDKILEEINSWHGYDSKLFKLVYYDGISMRKLSRDTKISVSSIFNTIKKSREIIRVKFEGDFNELKD